MINFRTREYRWRQIVWDQDAHGQWSSGHLEIKPFWYQGKIRWQIVLDGERVGRDFGYPNPRQAKVSAALIRKVREVAEVALGPKTVKVEQ